MPIVRPSRSAATVWSRRALEKETPLCFGLIPASGPAERDGRREIRRTHRTKRHTTCHRDYDALNGACGAPHVMAGVILRVRTMHPGHLRGISSPFPDTISDVDALDSLLSDPSDQAVAALSQLPGDIIVLGVAGKMGPTLARMARRAADLAGSERRVIGVARFSEPTLEAWLQSHRIETIRCDLLDERTVSRLPDAPLVVYMAGRKFGSTGQESLTWAMNAALPVEVARRYAGSRIAAFSTGNVYGLTPVAGGGSRETDPLRPVGEYAMSCLARERLFEHFSIAQGTRDHSAAAELRHRDAVRPPRGSGETSC